MYRQKNRACWSRAAREKKKASESIEASAADDGEIDGLMDVNKEIKQWEGRIVVSALEWIKRLVLDINHSAKYLLVNKFPTNFVGYSVTS